MASSEEASGFPVGAYGLRLAGVDSVASLLVPALESWPRIELVAQVGPPSPAPELVTSDRGELRLLNGGRLVIDRGEGRAVFTHGTRLRPEELVHPYLAPAAALIGRWLGRESFHAGAFALNGGVWALLGDRESGKSSTLAWLALHGHQVVCDDMLILDGDAAFAGPRSVDLRAETARHFGAGDELGVVGTRERWRLELEQLEGQLPLKGWIFLSWGERVEMEPVPIADRLGRLLEHRALRLPSDDPGGLLDLSALPGFELRRPRNLDSVAETGGHLLERLGA